jgi:hypothetical protein
VCCAAAKPRVNAEKPRFFINAQKKYDFFNFPYFLEGHRLQAAKKKKIKKLKA